MRLFIRCLALVLACCLLPLWGCYSKNAPMDTAMRFLDAIKQRDFFAAYDLLSKRAKGQIEQKDFVTKYERIFDALGVEEILIQNELLEDQELVTRFEYDATYVTSVCGDMENTFSFTLVNQSGWYVEWTPQLILPGLEWGYTLSVISLPPKRGEIFAGETIYAQNVPATTIYINRERVDNMLSLAQSLGPLIAMSPTDITEAERKIKSGNIILLKNFLPSELDEETRNQIILIPGVGIDYGNYATIRYYPLERVMAHTIGYCGAITKEELDAALAEGYEYSPDTIIGKSGLEYAYEKRLRGTAGKEYYIADSAGLKRQSVFIIPPKDGEDIHLTIKPKLQKRLDEVLAFTLKQGQSGAAIMLNPDTGNILALSSYPTFDPNQFIRGFSPVDWAAMNDPESGNPLFNRITQGMFPPGSSFKPFTAAFALDSGVITPDTAFTGKIEDDYWTPEPSELPAGVRWNYPPIKRASWRHRQTPLNLRNAMIPSDNIYFADCAIKTGQEAFMSKCEAMGIGEAIPFDLPVVRSRLLNEGTEMNIKYLADSGYGQGEMLFTPLQMAATFASLAGSGNIYVPHIIESIYQTEGRKYLPVMKAYPEIWKSGFISDYSLSTLLPLLEAVVQEGTAEQLKLRNVAGKTGTAQITEKREISWFVGFTTGDGEKRLVLVALEVEPGEGGQIKLDISRSMLTANE